MFDAPAGQGAYLVPEHYRASLLEPRPVELGGQPSDVAGRVPADDGGHLRIAGRVEPLAIAHQLGGVTRHTMAGRHDLRLEGKAGAARMGRLARVDVGAHDHEHRGELGRVLWGVGAGAGEQQQGRGDDE